MSESRKIEVPVVLVALDGSPAAAAAISIGRAVTAQLGGALEFLHVTPDPISEAELRTRLALGDEDLRDARLCLEIGEPAEGILRRTADSRVAIVVLTTHGREIEHGHRIGRVAAAVIANTEQPILLVRPEAAPLPDDHPKGLQRLLLPLDGTPTTAIALRPATQLCSQLHASVDLLYVAGGEQPAPDDPGSIGAPRYLDQPQHEWPQWADEVLDRLLSCCAECPPDVPARAYLTQGEAGDEIVRFAAEHRYDAIVLARNSHLEPGRPPRCARSWSARPARSSSSARRWAPPAAMSTTISGSRSHERSARAPDGVRSRWR